MIRKPNLTILLPVYNAEKYLKETITSILNQTYENFELLICDDYSKDNSVKIIESFKDNRIKFFQNKKNLGKNQTINNLINKINGKYFTVHDADDISIKNRFEIQINYLEEYHDIEMCGTSFEEISKDGKHLSFVEMNTNISEIMNKQSFPDKSYFHGPTLLFRSDLPKKVGGFYRLQFRTGEDIEFCTRVCEKYKATNINQVLYKYRLLDSSLTKSIETYNYANLAHIEFGKYIQNIRRNHGIDLFEKLSTNKIENLFNKFVKYSKKNQEQYYKIGINRSLYFNLFKNALILNMKLIKLKPFNLSSYKYLLTSCLIGLGLKK